MKNQPKKRVSRRQKDEQNTRILYGVLGAAAIVIALVLVGQAVNQYYLTPRKVLATVNGSEITREDYWKYRSNVLVNQISQYQQYASFFQGEQQQQYLAMAQQASAQLDEVWGSKDTDPTTLESMIDDQLYLDGLDSLGLSISDEDVQDFIDRTFRQSGGAALYTNLDANVHSRARGLGNRNSNLCRGNRYCGSAGIGHCRLARSRCVAGLRCREHQASRWPLKTQVRPPRLKLLPARQSTPPL